MKFKGLTKTNGALWDGAGLHLKIRRHTLSHDRVMIFSDLNPEVKIERVFSRLETLRIGLYFLMRAIYA